MSSHAERPLYTYSNTIKSSTSSYYNQDTAENARTEYTKQLVLYWYVQRKSWTRSTFAIYRIRISNCSEILHFIKACSCTYIITQLVELGLQHQTCSSMQI